MLQKQKPQCPNEDLKWLEKSNMKLYQKCNASYYLAIDGGVTRYIYTKEGTLDFHTDYCGTEDNKIRKQEAQTDPPPPSGPTGDQTSTDPHSPHSPHSRSHWRGHCQTPSGPHCLTACTQLATSTFEDGMHLPEQQRAPRKTLQENGCPHKLLMLCPFY